MVNFGYSVTFHCSLSNISVNHTEKKVVVRKATFPAVALYPFRFTLRSDKLFTGTATLTCCFVHATTDDACLLPARMKGKL